MQKPLNSVIILFIIHILKSLRYCISIMLILKKYSSLASNLYRYSNISLKYKIQQNSAFLTLTNEKKRNPLSLDTIKQIGHALIEVSAKAETDNIKILVIQSTGTVFSAGHDLKQLKASKSPQQIFEECTKTLLFLKKMPLITLCAVNGVAAAAGFQMALTCDLLLATQKSTFSTPGVKWGLFCSTPGVQLIRSISSLKKANEMLLFGEPISAQQALNYGLVNKVMAAEKLNDEINGYIAKAKGLSGQVLRLGKEVLQNQATQQLEKAYCTATKGMRDNILDKKDCQEGLTAFAEKRHPHFNN